MSPNHNDFTIQGRSAAYLTLGCKLNFAETSTLGDRLAALGVRRAAEGEVADICVINTCSVTETSDQKCRQAIRRMVRQHPGAFVVVTGCYAQLSAPQIAQIEGVDLVLGMEFKGRVVEELLARYPEHVRRQREAAQSAAGQPCTQALHESMTVPLRDIRSFMPSCSRGERTRYFLKVQDGCNYFCTYCTIPYARGRSRNASIASLVAQAEAVAEAGGKEIILTGVNIGDFGQSTGETFYDLVQALDAVKGIQRYRISSIEPNLLTPDIIRFCARSRAFMPHFHLPLQCGSDEVLRLMHRRYTASFFRERVAMIREMMPDAFIGVDVIVGTRGETEERFDEALAFCSTLDVAQYHVFTYSERPGTMALRIPHVVDEQEKHRRSARLIAVSEAHRRAFYERFTGQVRPALMEHARPGQPVRGFTDNYIRVELPAGSTDATLVAGAVLPLRLGGFTDDGAALRAEFDPASGTSQLKP